MKLKDIINQFKSNANFVVILKALGSIALITAVATISVHFLTGQTLSEYALENPEKAYGTVSDTQVSVDEQRETDIQESSVILSEDGTQEESDDYSETNIQESSDIDEASVSSDTNMEAPSAVPENSSDESAINNINVQVSDQVHFYDLSSLNSKDNTIENRTVYADGFYYEPLNATVTHYITGISFPSDTYNTEISYDDLRYVGILYNDFNNTANAGEIICNKAIAEDLVSIFSELYESGYQFEKIALVDNYDGDDTASMLDNNTSCFNYRPVDGTDHLSKHAYGLAIDINPFYNPYIVFNGNEDGSDYISPSGSEIYADRSQSFPYKIDENDLCYKLFIAHGFKWGGNWNSCKDYQHFQK